MPSGQPPSAWPRPGTPWASPGGIPCSCWSCGTAPASPAERGTPAGSLDNPAKPDKIESEHGGGRAAGGPPGLQNRRGRCSRPGVFDSHPPPPAQNRPFGTRFRRGGETSEPCLEIGDVSSGEGFWAAGKRFFRRNPDGFQGRIALSSGRKTRRLGISKVFKQGQAGPGGSSLPTATRCAGLAVGGRPAGGCRKQGLFC